MKVAPAWAQNNVFGKAESCEERYMKAAPAWAQNNVFGKAEFREERYRKPV